jgi:hypothetical protein
MPAETFTVTEPETQTARETAEETEISVATESEASQKKCTVVKHADEGKAMVTAGEKTISVPTTFEGLAAEGFTFSGAENVLEPGKTGQCRVGYRNAFNNIRLTVKNTTDDYMRIRDCTIIGVETGSVTRDPDLTLYGIPMGAKWSDVLSTYGKPFSQTDADENGVASVTYQFGTDINSSQVVFVYFKNGNVIDATYEDFSITSK